MDWLPFNPKVLNSELIGKPLALCVKNENKYRYVRLAHYDPKHHTFRYMTDSLPSIPLRQITHYAILTLPTETPDYAQ